MKKQKIKILILDVDGTLTDGKIYTGNDGEALKAFDVKDGYGIRNILPRINVDWRDYNSRNPQAALKGVIPVVITARRSPIIENRCKELDIRHCFQGCADKLEQLKIVAESFGITARHVKKCGSYHKCYEEIACIGDDRPDIPVMHRCGLSGCPSDAVKDVVKIADFVSAKPGGNGAVREFIEWIAAKTGF